MLLSAECRQWPFSRLRLITSLIHIFAVSKPSEVQYNTYMWNILLHSMSSMCHIKLKAMLSSNDVRNTHRLIRLVGRPYVVLHFNEGSHLLRVQLKETAGKLPHTNSKN